MVDFTSALYLGLRHASESLRPWAQLTSGRPAALGSPPGADEVANRFAELQGCARATLGTSTLHLFWDLFGVFPNRGHAIYFDAGTYPIARWGIERASARGIYVCRFRHHDSEALHRLLTRNSMQRLRPLVVADGFCPRCGKPAPLTAYLEYTRAAGGYLIVDDTQAIGIIGRSPDSSAPYGKDGGGSLQWNSISGPEVIVINSLAKGFGVPMAVLAGSDRFVRWFEINSETRVHTSPPSIAIIHAAEHALSVNWSDGNALRLRLAQLVCYFRRRVAQIGGSTTGGIFPVQTLTFTFGLTAPALYRHLSRLGVRTLLLRGGCTDDQVYVSFIVTTRHNQYDIDHAVEAVARATVSNDYELETADASFI
jgi:8-amino-7-oxononanoate synthase